jgi:hypothetical protein
MNFSQINEVSTFITQFLILVAVTLTILLPSHTGQQVITESEKLNESLFHFSHFKRSKKFKSSLMIFKERLKQPLQVTAFGVFQISLQTFLSVINMTYTLFTALRTLRE